MNEIIEKFLQDNSEIIMKVVRVLEGKSATARIKLDGIQFKVGDATIGLSGEVDLKFVPQKGAKEKTVVEDEKK